MNWIDIKYTNLLSNRLDQFKRKGETLFNFRCPICGDSERNKLKARGYIYGKNGKMFYRCHNCHASMTFRSFLETVNPDLYKEYVTETFAESGHRRPTFVPDISKFAKPRFKKKGPLSKLKTISQLAHDHPVKKYVVKRQIPNFFHSQLFYAPKFFKFCNTVDKDRFKEDNDHPRLIIPFFDQWQNVFGFQGRSFGKVEPRYLTIMIDEKPKVYGLDRVDFSKKNYILEGPIDSMFLPNAIAMAGSDLNTQEFDFSNSVFIFDNEPRSDVIVKKIEQVLSQGHDVFVWPKNIEYKDINDCVLAGIAIEDIISTRTFSGLAGQMALNEWKRC